MRSGGCAGSSRVLRLDPFGLPVRFLAGDATADGHVREVELHRERVVLRRALRGMRMALNMPVAASDGVALWLVPVVRTRWLSCSSTTIRLCRCRYL